MATYRNTLTATKERIKVLEKENWKLKNRIERLEKTEIPSAQKHIQFLEQKRENYREQERGQEESLRELADFIDTIPNQKKGWFTNFSEILIILGGGLFGIVVEHLLFWGVVALIGFVLAMLSFV